MARGLNQDTDREVVTLRRYRDLERLYIDIIFVQDKFCLIFLLPFCLGCQIVDFSFAGSIGILGCTVIASCLRFVEINLQTKTLSGGKCTGYSIDAPTKTSADNRNPKGTQTVL